MSAKKKILLDNAYSAWSAAIEYCDAILKGMATLKNRKDFVSNLQNAVELFMKQIMLDKNDYRVATVRNSGEDGEPAKSYYCALDLNEFFMSASDEKMKKFYSIEFAEIVKIHRKILDGFLVEHQTFKAELELLAHLRNGETHFYIEKNSFLHDNNFVILHNFMVDFYKVLKHYNLLPFRDTPFSEHQYLEFDRTKILNYTYINAVCNASLVKKITVEAAKITFADYPGESAYSIASAIYSCAREPFKEPFNEVWACIEVLDQFDLIEIHDDTFECEGVQAEYFYIQPHEVCNYYIDILVPVE